MELEIIKLEQQRSKLSNSNRKNGNRDMGRLMMIAKTAAGWQVCTENTFELEEAS